MKKSLVLAMAMALGVTASAYAANPFSDVPAGHWAYDSIDKLAAAGVIDGMGDGSFQGDKTMTRYEMAQIVAKAMAKGANVDKLAAEFADELDALGVRVAALEKKADNVKITGAINLHTRSHHAASASSSNHYYRLRSDLTLKGQVNEDWTYTALLRNDQILSGADAGKGEEDVVFQRAWVDGKVGGLKVTAGRINRKLGNGEVYSDRMDAVQASYGKKVNVTVGYAQLANSGKAQEYGVDAKVLYAEAKANLGKRANVLLTYNAFKDLDSTKAKAPVNDDFNVFSATLGYKLTKSLAFEGTYLNSDANVAKSSNDGYALKLAYKGAKASAPGSWGLYAKYIDIPKAVMVGSDYTTNQNWVSIVTDGVKGTMFGANYAFAKNIVGTVEYSHGEGKDVEAEKNKNYDTLFAGLAFTF